MVTEVHGDYGQVKRHLKFLQTDLPTEEGAARLEAVLDAAFEATQAAVHVISGSLRASGKTASDHRDGQWEGSITYGGISPGFPNNPVVYAWYEARRDGQHDFMLSWLDFNEAFAHAVGQAMTDG